MAKNDNVRMPTSTAGLTRYFEDCHSKFEIKPGHVVVMCVVVMLITLILHQFGQGWFGA